MAWYDKWAVMTITAAIWVGAYNWIRWPDVEATIVAYWVQAIGSIAAILGSFYLMSKQNKAAIKLVADADLRSMQRRARSVSAVTDRGYGKLIISINNVRLSAVAESESSIRTAFRTSLIVLNQIRSALEQVPAHELGSYTLVEGLHLIIDAISMFERTAEIWQRQPQGTLDFPGILIEIPRLAEMAKAADDKVKRGLIELGVS